MALALVISTEALSLNVLFNNSSESLLRGIPCSTSVPIEFLFSNQRVFVKPAVVPGE